MSKSGHDFSVGDHVVYPAHGVGQVQGIETQEVAGLKLEVYEITFDHEKMTLRVPTAKAKTAGLRSGTRYHWLWDYLIFNGVKDRLGGRVRAILTGSAPISPQALDFLRMAFLCEVYEGYGQTESCAGSALTLNGDYEAGHVGVPVPCNDIKLVDVPGRHERRRGVGGRRGASGPSKRGL